MAEAQLNPGSDPLGATDTEEIKGVFTQQASERLTELEKEFGRKIRFGALRLAEKEKEKLGSDDPRAEITRAHVQHSYDALVRGKSLSRSFLRDTIQKVGLLALGGGIGSLLNDPSKWVISTVIVGVGVLFVAASLTVGSRD